MKECKNCGNKIPNRNVYCNNQCQNDYENKQRLNEWMDGKNFTRQGGTSIPQWMRRHLLENSNYQCRECGWGQLNEYTNTVPLDIDHIDGDAYNNMIDNLKVLCPNCHSLKKTFKKISP